MSKGEIFGLLGLACSAIGGIFAFKADKAEKAEMKAEIEEELYKKFEFEKFGEKKDAEETAE